MMPAAIAKAAGITRGPWFANAYGATIFVENYPREDQTDNPAHRMIAQVLDEDNAALVAAAPALAASLRRLLALHIDCQNHQDHVTARYLLATIGVN